jgi:hypothetical protein
VNRLRLIVAILALTAAAITTARAADDYTLYEPKPATSSRPPASPEEGLLVRNIVIQPGDTLWRLASRYRGKGSYYPQFLILNKIADPDLIYAGKIIRVPVTPDRPVTPRAHRTPEKKPAMAPPATRPVRRHDQPVAATTPPTAAPRVGSNEENEQLLFEAASRAYKTGDCRLALERFDQFLNRYPSSPLAADVSLYKADCYMKLSEQ